MSWLPQCKLQKRIWSQKLAFQANVRKKSQLDSAHVRSHIVLVFLLTTMEEKFM